MTAEVMDLTPVIDVLETDDGVTSLAITRRAAGSYVNGVYTGGSTSAVTIQAHIQPASTKDIELLPEGLRTKHTLAVFAKQEIYAADEPGGGQGDQFQWGGKTYEVQRVRNWLEIAGVCKGIATKVDLA